MSKYSDKSRTLEAHSELIMSRQGFAEIRCLWSNEKIIVAQNFVFGELAIFVGVGVVDEMVRLSVCVVEIWRDDPVLYLNTKGEHSFLNPNQSFSDNL